MKRSMNDDGDYGGKRRPAGGMNNEMRILLPSQVQHIFILLCIFTRLRWN